jgi:enoyl-[acyl-carrier protein] reductase II
VHETALVGRGGLPIRQLANRFSETYLSLERKGASGSELIDLYNSTSLKKAALDGDVEWGKVEAGQSAGLVEDIVPAAELFRRLVRETEAARKRLASL